MQDFNRSAASMGASLLLLSAIGLVVPTVFHALGPGAGECNWMEGVQLLAVYLILGLAFYFLPATP